RNEPERRPAVFVRDTEIAVAWIETGTDNLRFQRFAANDGHALDAAPLTLGLATSTSATAYVTHDGTRYVVAWARFDGTNHSVLMRFVDNAGALVGAAPQTVVTQRAALAAPHVAWDARNARYLLAWVSDERQAGGDVKTQLADQNGAPIPGALTATAVQAPAGKRLRRAALAAHPTAGFALTWEDDTRGTQDAYFALLGDNGVPDLRVPFNRLLLSDIPGDTQGASALVTPDGIAAVWHGTVRANPPLLAVDALALTTAGTFRTQRDPRTPLLDSGRWVRHTVHDEAAHDQTAVAAAWAGGDWFLLRAHRASARSATAELVHTNADGLPDAAYGPDGARTMDSGRRYAALAAYSTGDELVTAVLRDAGMSLYLFDAGGAPVNAFGTAGKVDVADAFDTAATPALLHRGVAATFQIAVAYAKRAAGGAIPTFRLIDHAGATVKTIRDTANRMTGTARHDWFRPTAIASPQFIAIWHRTAGATTTLRVQLFNLDAAADTPQNVTAGSFTVPAGDARCAVLAPRPGAFDPNAPPPPGGFNLNALTRMYGVAFQHRAAPADRWQVRFITLDRTGNAPAATLSTVVVDTPNRHQTEPQLAWHVDGYGLAWLERPTTSGPNTLMFACLDATGAALTAPFAVSNGTADVHAFRLVWNGRRFHLTWAETEAGRTRHVQRAVSVLHERTASGYDAPFAHPSSALVRATLINGATNIDGTALPNYSNNVNHGYGWGRMNLRQTFAPAAPVTFQARDDGAVMRMRTARYVFTLLPGMRLLRVTLNWTDPPGPNVMNELSLRVTTPAWSGGATRTYIGNHWSAATPRYSDPLPAPPAAQPAFDGTQTTEQIVIPGDPTLPSGDYVVEVIAGAFTGSLLQPFPGQPFALVFVGSGDEWNLAPPTSAGAVGFF
ncbi:MAG TPA: hypothetical protein VE826_10780, partial [Dongiaceae bacterium]|nr:hypothetical protein [Dongiaceae bacterium]